MKNKSIRTLGLVSAFSGVGLMIFSFVSVTGLVITGEEVLEAGSMLGVLLFIAGIFLMIIGKEEGKGFREILEAFKDK
jgi:uncharacterized membrane protein YgdD (TMEM256/DUF423 family)